MLQAGHSCSQATKSDFIGHTDLYSTDLREKKLL